MHHLTVGSGADIFLLHGWGASSSAFSFVLDALGRAGFRATAPDFAGFGATPEPEAPRGVPEYAADALALADELGAEKAIWVGHSFGGRVALEIAAKHPERAAGLVLVDSAGLRPRRPPSYHIRVALHKLLKRLGGSGLKGSADYRELSPVMKAVFVRVVNYDETPLLARIACPTAVFWGDRDRETPLYMAKRFVRGIEDSRLFMLSGGHFAYAEDPDRFMRVLIAFVRALTN